MTGYRLINEVLSYIPGVGTEQATSNHGSENGQVKDNRTPPTRPDNDVQVEEFLRGQYMTGAKEEQRIKGTKKK